MTDLNTVIEDPSAEERSLERPVSKTRIVLPRHSILMSSGGSHSSHSGSGFNSPARTRRQSSRNSFYRIGYDRRLIRYENTYRMEPDEDDKIDLVRTRRFATNVIESAIAGYKYDANHAKQFTAILADRIRNQMKQLPYPRYKIVAQVSIGQKKAQDLRVTSRCLWDIKLDRHITITKETLDAYVTVTIFFVYTE
jgi:hypothetical protein